MAGDIKGITIEFKSNTVEFDNSLKDLNKGLSLLKSEFSNLNTSLKLDPTNAEKFEDVMKNLEEQIKLNTARVEEFRQKQAELEPLDPSYDEEWQKYENQIGKATNQIEWAQQKQNDLTETFNEATSAIGDTEAETKSFKDRLNEAGQEIVNTIPGLGALTDGLNIGLIAGFAAATAAAVSLGKELIELANETASFGDDIDKNSQRLGISRQSYQEWGYILSQNGSDISVLRTGMRTLSNAVDDAANGSTAAQKKFERLGLSFEDVQKASPDELFGMVVSALQDMDEGAEKNAIANDILGRSYQDLLPLLNGSAEDVEKLRENFNELGIGMSDEAVDAAVEYTDTLDTMNRVLDSVKYSIGSVLLPIFTNAMNLIIKAVGLFKNVWGQFADFIGEKIDLIWQFIEPVWTNIREIFEIYMPIVIEALKPVWESFQELIATVWQLIETIIIAAWDRIWEKISPAIELLKKIWTENFDAIWEYIQNFWNLISTIFEVAFTNLKNLLDIFIKIFQGDWSGAWEAIKKYVSDAWEGIKKIFSAFIPYFKSLWNLLKGVFSSVGSFFYDKFNDAWTRVKNIFSSVGSFFGGIWDTIKEKFTNLGTDIGEAISGAVKTGINSLIGIVEGAINDAIGLINGAIRLINKLPGVNVGSVGTVSFPRLASGGILLDNTLLSDGSNFFIGGEAGPEAVIPLKPSVLAGIGEGILNSSHSIFNGLNEGINTLIEEVQLLRAENAELKVYMDTGELVGSLSRPVENDIIRRLL